MRCLRRTLALALLAVSVGAAGAAPKAPERGPKPKFSEAVAFDATAPLRTMFAPGAAGSAARPASGALVELRPERGPEAVDQGYSGDGALQGAGFKFFADIFSATTTAAPAPATNVNFEGISNTDNFNLFGFRQDKMSEIFNPLTGSV